MRLLRQLLPEEDVLDDPDDDDEADPTVPGDLWFLTGGREVHRILGSVRQTGMTHGSDRSH
jgi:hypothetical protein